MEITIDKLEDEYRLKLDYSNRIEICYIKDIRRLLEYTLTNMMYSLEGKSEYLNNNYAKLNIEYEKEE